MTTPPEPKLLKGPDKQWHPAAVAIKLWRDYYREIENIRTLSSRFTEQAGRPMIRWPTRD